MAHHAFDEGDAGVLSLANERTVLEALREAVGSMLHSYPTSLVSHCSDDGKSLLVG